jgi:hypothetical protein
MSKATSCKSCTFAISQLELKIYRLGLPKKGETFFFFKINDWSIHDFCKQLGDLLPRITTAIQVQHDQARIAQEQKRARLEGTDSQILDMTGINIAFSQQGLLQVSDTIIQTIVRNNYADFRTPCQSWASLMTLEIQRLSLDSSLTQQTLPTMLLNGILVSKVVFTV